MASDSGIVFSYAGHFSGSSEVPRHSHRGAELVLVTRGTCFVEFDDAPALAAGPGGLYVTPPGVAHRQHNTPDCETFYAVMEVEPDRFDTSTRVVDSGGDALLRRWFGDLLELNFGYELETASNLLAAVWCRIVALEQRLPARERLHPGLLLAQDFMRRHYMENFTLSELARQCGLSLSYLNLLFRKESGAGPLAWLTALRMKQARRLLLNPYLNIAEVAERTGCGDANYFTRKFRLYHGITPGEFRRDPAAGADRTSAGI